MGTHMMMLLSVNSAAYLAGARLATSTGHAINRAAVGMYLPEEDPKDLLSRVQWVKSENGLSFKELDAGSGAMPEPSQTVTIAYKASYLSSGEIIEETAKSRPLGFTLGSDSVPMFQEAVVFKVQQAVGSNRNLFRLALFSTFLPDILN